MLTLFFSLLFWPADFYHFWLHRSLDSTRRAAVRVISWEVARRVGSASFWVAVWFLSLRWHHHPWSSWRCRLWLTFQDSPRSPGCFGLDCFEKEINIYLRVVCFWGRMPAGSEGMWWDQVPGNWSGTGNRIDGIVVWDSEGFTRLGHTLGSHQQRVPWNLLSSWEKKRS